MYDYAQYSYQHTHDMYTYVAQILFQNCVKFAYFGESDAKLCQSPWETAYVACCRQGGVALGPAANC